MDSVYIAALAHHHPIERLTNEALASGLDTSEEWIIDRTGIAERRRVAPGERSSHLAVVATRHALKEAGWSPQDVELLVCATSSPDTMLPAAAAHIGRELGTDAVAFDVNAACAGFAYAMATARSMMPSMGFRRAAVCCAETYTAFTDYSDRRTAVLFGDGAATALLQTSPPAWGAEVVDVDLRNWHDGLDFVQVPCRGTWHLEGPKIKGPALKMMADSALRTLERNGLAVADLRAFMAHQANYRILEALADHLGVREDQHWSNVRLMGNQGAAGVLATLSEGVALRSRELRAGDPILLTVVGAGFTSGSVLLRWLAGR